MHPILHFASTYIWPQVTTSLANMFKVENTGWALKTGMPFPSSYTCREMQNQHRALNRQPATQLFESLQGRTQPADIDR